ncbi:MAG: acylphosphatase [Thiohalorhabdus sp.]|uniref:acylphosphatase n=1 Tax=Thiohalorhabdus sp. TaxID=3094134 RepID=UPI00398029D9
MQRHYTIHGRVQGVFFRDSTRRKARELGLGGWVRNLPDGSVEAVVAGDAEGVRALEDWFRQGGPPAAHVERVDASDQEEETFGDFRVR